MTNYSNTPSNAVWVKEGTSVSGNTVTASAGAGYHAIYQSAAITVDSEIAYIIAADVEQGTTQYVTVGERNDAVWRYTTFNFSSVAISGNLNNLASGYVDLGNGRYRVWLKVKKTNSGVTNAFIAPNTLSSALHSYTAAGTETVNVFNFYVSALTYETAPRSSDLVTTAASAYYGPRFEYDINTLTALGLHIEGAATNVSLYSRDLTNAVWTKTNMTAALTQTGVDGMTNNATLLTATAANATVLQSVTLASSSRAQSVYIKRVSGSGAIAMTTDGGTTWTNITVTSSWARQSIPYQTVTNPNFGIRIATSGDSVAVDYMQNETGVVTSAIPVRATAITRAAEVFTLTGSAAMGATRTYVVETSAIPYMTAENSALIGTDAQIPLYITTSNISGSAALASYNGVTALATGSTVSYTSTLRCALTFNTAGRSVVFNGGTVASDTAVISAGSTTYLGRGPSGVYLNGFIKTLAVYTSIMTSTQLKQKSGIGAAL